MRKKVFVPKDYIKKNPKRASIIQKAVKRGVKEYEETFRRLAAI